MSRNPNTLFSFRKHSLSTLAGISLMISVQIPAFAAIENVLKMLPQQAVGAVSVDLQPKSWKFLLQQPFLTDLLMDSELKDMVAEMKKMTGIEFTEVLSTLGTHGAIAFYHPQTSGGGDMDVVISLELNSDKTYQKFLAYLKQANADPKVNWETYKNSELVLFTPDKTETDPLKSDQGGMSLQNNTLVITSKVPLLKQVLDRDAISQGLLDNASFKPVFQSLGQEPIFFWVDIKGLKDMPNPDMESFRKDLEAIGLTNENLAMNKGFGLSMRLDEQGLAFKNSLSLNTEGLSGTQQAYLNKLTGPHPSLDSLLALMPARPLFAGMSSIFNLAFENPILSTDKSSTKSDEFAAVLKEIMESTKKNTGLDLKQDIFAHSDGRVGFSAFYLDNFPNYKTLPAMVAMLGVKDGKRFLSNLQQKLKIVSDEIASGADSKPAKPITLAKTPVETYQNIPLYLFEGDEGLKSMAKEIEVELEPCFAVYNEVFLVATSRSALRATLDHAMHSRVPLLEDPEFTRVRGRMNGKCEVNLFYSDLNRVYRIADHFLHDESWFKVTKPLFSQFRALAGDGVFESNRSQGNFLIDAALNKVDFAKLAAEIKKQEDLDKINRVESNMNSLAEAVKMYAQRHAGKLPANASLLIDDAQKNEYNSKLGSSNPFNESFGLAVKPDYKGALLDFKNWKVIKSSPTFAGLVLFEYIGGTQSFVRLYGTDAQGELIKHQGKVYFIDVKAGK